MLVQGFWTVLASALMAQGPDVNVSGLALTETEVSIEVNPTNPHNRVIMGHGPGGPAQVVNTFHTFDGGVSWKRVSIGQAEDRAETNDYSDDFESGIGDWDADGATLRTSGGVNGSQYLEGRANDRAPVFWPDGSITERLRGDLRGWFGFRFRVVYSGRTFAGNEEPIRHRFVSATTSTVWEKQVADGTLYLSGWEDVSVNINTDWTDLKAMEEGWTRTQGSDSWWDTLRDVGRQEFFVGGGMTGAERVAGIDNIRVQKIALGRGDPTLAFDDDGNLYVAYLATFHNEATKLYVAKSVDSGRTYSQFVDIDRGHPSVYADKEIIATGPDPTTPAQQNVYMAWVGTGIELSRSTDGGATFEPPVRVGRSGTFPEPAVGPKGEVYVSWYSGPNIYVNTSTDGGQSFGTAVLVSTSSAGFKKSIPANPKRGIFVGPTIEVDRSGGSHNGRVYVAFVDGGTHGHPDYDVFVAYSDDQGATWSTPVRVNDDTGDKSQFLPWIDVDPRTGIVGVVWYDTRDDPSNRKAHVYVSSSNDGGVSYQRNVRLSDCPSDQSDYVSPGVGNKYNFLGYREYIGISIENGEASVAWTDNSLVPGNQDFFYDKIDLTQLPPSCVEAELHQPRPGTFIGAEARFRWSTPADAEQYRLLIGTTPGAGDVIDQTTTCNSLIVNGLPTGTIYATLKTKCRSTGLWVSSNGVYEVDPVTIDCLPAVIYWPAHGAINPNDPSDGIPEEPFYWNQPSGATAFRLDVGTTPGGNDVYSMSTPTPALSFTVMDLPLGTIYTTLYTQCPSGWLPTHARFYVSNYPTEALESDIAHVNSPRPQMILDDNLEPPEIRPTIRPSDVIDSTTHFTWNLPPVTSQFELNIGSVPGGSDLFSERTTDNALLVTGLPPGMVYANLRTQCAKTGAWLDFYSPYRVTSTVPVPPTIGNSPAAVAMTIEEGTDAPPAFVEVLNTNANGIDALNYFFTKSHYWLSFSPSQGTHISGPPNEHEILFNTVALPPGVHQATIRIISNAATNNPQEIPVRIEVTPASVTPVVVRDSTPYHQRFESLPGPADGWDYRSTKGTGRITINDDSIRFDSSERIFDLPLPKEVGILHADLLGQSNVVLTFSTRRGFSEENSVADFVAISQDGGLSRKVWSPPNDEPVFEWHTVEVDLDAALVAGFPPYSYTSDFRIIFSHEGGHFWPNQSREFDDIQVFIDTPSAKPKIWLSSDRYFVDEDDPTGVKLTVMRSGEMATTVQALVVWHDDSARAGTHYFPEGTNQLLTFQPGDRFKKTAAITINDDNAVAISNLEFQGEVRVIPSEADLGPHSEAVVEIIDDDVYPRGANSRPLLVAGIDPFQGKSTIDLQGVQNKVIGLMATLYDVRQTSTLDALLVGPSGQAVMLMSDASPNLSATETEVNLTFSSDSLFIIPDSGALVSHNYLPFDYDHVGDEDLFTSDGAPLEPPGGFSVDLTDFNNLDPNGTWTLFLARTAIVGEPLTEGGIAGGWALQLLTTEEVGGWERQSTEPLVSLLNALPLKTINAVPSPILRSGELNNGEVSLMIQDVVGPARLSYWWSVDCEPDYDRLSCFFDHEFLFAISGEQVPWERRVIYVPEGRHRVSWEYSKDRTVSVGEDAGWVDRLELVKTADYLELTGKVSPLTNTYHMWAQTAYGADYALRDSTDLGMWHAIQSGLTGTGGIIALDPLDMRSYVSRGFFHVVEMPNELAAGPFIESGGLVVMEAEHFDVNQVQEEHAWVRDFSQTGLTGTAAMLATPNTGTVVTEDVEQVSPKLSYRVDFTQTGTYRLWVRMIARSGADNSVWVGLDDNASASFVTVNADGMWHWDSVAVTVDEPGVHEINVWMREDGLFVDRLTLDGTTASTPDDDLPESPRGL